ncbi:MAG: hypothetical protein DBY32_08995 [Phascolarctobacterium sp.]|nr:MAG: hypothetical protein DBY32_08995 [Phascolarctobacterium sp.]
MKRVIMEDWLEERRNILKLTPPQLRPRNRERQIKSRSFAERRALAFACKKAWEDALRTGRFKKVGNGYYSIC